jgi:large subunit ribosomal protein L5e
MVYVKVERASSYYSRYQVKYKRRRAGKTDYRARLRLVTQDKNKYNTPKYRFVVRFTNKDVICQIAYATVAGDVVVSAAYSHELPKYGLKAGLSNYAAAYCTGLLLARRVLNKFGLDKTYVGLEEANGEDFNVEEVEDGPRPFKALLDTGLKRTSTGSKVFAALKGALDGGLDVPHSAKRFVGFNPEKKELDAETLQKYIFGGHVGEYMTEMEEDSEEKYNSHFSQYIESEMGGDDLEDLIKEVHQKIREDPTHQKKDRSKPSDSKIWKPKKLTYEERKQKLKERLQKLKAAADEDDE